MVKQLSKGDLTVKATKNKMKKNTQYDADDDVSGHIKQLGFCFQSSLCSDSFRAFVALSGVLVSTT